tara:strand:- start:517 stop:1062 length:546 start_codon:yes stop_codon:yes gene_type:complete
MSEEISSGPGLALRESEGRFSMSDVIFYGPGVRWLVVREIDSRVLLYSNKWSSSSNPGRYKLYKQQSAATAALERFGAPLVADGHFESRGKIIAVYPGDIINRSGVVVRCRDFEITGSLPMVLDSMVDNFHCSTSQLEVARKLRAKFKRSWRYAHPYRRRLMLTYVLARHNANRLVWKAYS